jgi:hypothetical protein
MEHHLPPSHTSIHPFRPQRPDKLFDIPQTLPPAVEIPALEIPALGLIVRKGLPGTGLPGANISR